MSSSVSPYSQQTCTELAYAGALHLVGADLIADHKDFVNTSIVRINQIGGGRRMSEKKVSRDMAELTKKMKEESALAIEKRMAAAEVAITNLHPSEREGAWELWVEIVPGFLKFWDSALDGIMAAIVAMKDWVVGVVKCFQSAVRKHFEAAVRAFDEATMWLSGM